MRKLVKRWVDCVTLAETCEAMDRLCHGYCSERVGQDLHAETVEAMDRLCHDVAMDRLCHLVCST